MYSAGDCIHIQTNHYPNGIPKFHLFVVILDAKNEDSKTILIPICSIEPGVYFDNTTVLEVGDHNFIKQSSFADYYYALLLSTKIIDQMISEDKARKISKGVDIIILEKIKSGVMKSEHTKIGVQEFYEDSLYNSF